MMDCRAFITALFGGAVTMKYADGMLLAAPIPDVLPTACFSEVRYSRWAVKYAAP
jgi:hypothetical protein